MLTQITRRGSPTANPNSSPNTYTHYYVCVYVLGDELGYYHGTAVDAGMWRLATNNLLHPLSLSLRRLPPADPTILSPLPDSSTPSLGHRQELDSSGSKAPSPPGQSLHVSPNKTRWSLILLSVLLIHTSPATYCHQSSSQHNRPIKVPLNSIFPSGFVRNLKVMKKNQLKSWRKIPIDRCLHSLSHHWRVEEKTKC